MYSTCHQASANRCCTVTALACVAGGEGKMGRVSNRKPSVTARPNKSEPFCDKPGTSVERCSAASSRREARR